MKHLLFNSFCRKPVLLLGFQLLMACLAAAPLPGSTGISFYLNQAGFNNEGPKLAVLQAGAALASPTSFTVTDSATGKLAFSGVLQGPQKIN
ncbi:MAG TPA: cellulase N-terminal Ig-like domain-containing protein, partial [Puia sp.]|nr:cellulase N-terminal Ig-like domain-containing protein [Puia sp.]